MGAPHSARAVKVPSREPRAAASLLDHPSDADANARASREDAVSCFQCDLDIPHVCYQGMPNARWGLGDEAMAVLEGAQRHGFMLSADQLSAWQSSSKKKKRRPR
jgi:hypothetical protein